MIPKRFLTLLSFLLIGYTSFSQTNITGAWEGIFLSTQFALGQPKLVVEIYNFKDSIFTGITHLYYDDDKYEHYKVVGRYFKKDSVLVFIESETIAVDLGFYGNCLGTYMMKLKKQDNELRMEGIWDSNIRGCSPTTQVYLRKKMPPAPPPVVKNKATAKKPVATSRPAGNALNKTTTVIEKSTVAPVAAVPKNIPAINTAPFKMPPQLTQRETDVQSLLEIDAAEKDSIRVDVYDNGEIDGDSVSVYEEQVMRINKKLITAKPITFYVSLDKNSNPISHLRLVAESLGSIPPCTALMIVTTRSKRYEVHLSSNFKKNATVELFLKE